MTVIRVAAVVVVSFLAVGCSSVANVMGIHAKKVDPCAWLTKQKGEVGPSALDLVVILDRSDSMNTRRDHKVRDWYGQIFGKSQPADDSTLVFDNFRLPTPAHIRIGGFDGPGPVEWQPSISLPKLEGGKKYSERFGDRAGRCVKRQIVKAETSASENRGTDVLGAMSSAGRETGEDARQRKLVVVSDGIQTLGCADLRKINVARYEQVGRVTANCVAQRGVPSLAGWNVVLSGIGNPADGWPAPQAGTQTGLSALWAQLCASAVGRSGSCAFDARSPDGTKKKAAEGAPDPVVPFKRDEKPPPITLSSKLLFVTGKWDLRPAGRQSIRRAMAGVDPDEAGWVLVRGYTDSRGSDAYNLDLSRKRANAVADALRDLGLEHIQAEGEGEKKQACPEHGRTGRALAAAQECNRRVTIEYKVRK